jgi:hypothetical protein
LKAISLEQDRTRADFARLASWHIILRVFLPFTAAFYLSYLFRTINALISSELSFELALDAADIGFLTSVYFLSFAALHAACSSRRDQVADFLAKYADLKTEDGRQRIVRHGHLPEREVLTDGAAPAARA